VTRRSSRNESRARDPRQDLSPLLFLLCLLIPLCLHLVSRLIFTSVETGDLVTWFGAAACAFGLGLYALRMPLNAAAGHSRPLLVSMAGTLMFVISLGTTEDLGELKGLAWPGFGPVSVLLFLVVAIFLFFWKPSEPYSPRPLDLRVGKRRWLGRREVLLLGTSTSASFLFFGALPIQPSWGMADRWHSRFVVNEILGPLSGNWGGGNHIPTYTSVLGAPLVLLRPFTFTVGEIYTIGTLYISSLAFLTVSLIFTLCWKACTPALRHVLPFFAVALTLTAQAHPVGFTGPITQFSSAYPARMLPFVVTLLTLFQFTKAPSQGRAVILGVVIGAALLNNFEFGITTAVGAFFGMAMLRTSFRQMFLTATGTLVSIFAYCSALLIDGNTLDVAAWLLFGVGSASGFGSIPMPTFGPWIAVVAVFSFSAVLAVRRLRGSDLMADERVTLRPAYVVVLVTAVCGLMQFGYFASRSVNPGQLQIFLLHMALISAGLSHEMYSFGRKKVEARWVLAMLIALPALALPTVRWPLSEWGRVLGRSNSVNLSVGDTELLLDEELVRDFLQGRDAKDFVLLLEGSNIHSIGSGLPSVARTNHPLHLATSEQISRRICTTISKERNFIIASTVLQEATPPWCGAIPIRVADWPNDRVVLSNASSALP